MYKSYACDEVAELCGVTVTVVWNWIRSGRIFAVRTPNGYRISEFDFNEFTLQKEEEA